MNFFEVQAKYQKIITEARAKQNPESVPIPEPPAPLTESDLPEGMPLTNRLDKMTGAQATWAIENGDAWIAYLKANAGEVYQHRKNEPKTLSDADKYKSICDLLENVWLDLTDNMQRGYLTPDQKREWVATLEWAIKALPEGYEKQRDIFQDELAEYQPSTKDGEK